MASAEKITPPQSTPPDTGCVHGSGLNEGGVVPPRIQYASRLAFVTNLTPSGKQAFHNIPNRNPVDPNPVTVRVFTTVGGAEQEAAYPSGELKFTYGDPPNPPTFTPPLAPATVEPEAPFDLTILGSNFVRSNRTPVAVYALSVQAAPPVIVETRTFPVPATADKIVAKFGAGLPEVGPFKVFVEFSDNAAVDSGTSYVTPTF